MRKIGIIVEYNPLHNGHIYHLNNIKKNDDDIIIACMSSSITMRADISIFDKFTKTSQAIIAGVDIVCELGYAECVQRADIFAKNAIRILNSLGVNEIWIGSEKNNPNEYEKAYELLKANQAQIDEMIKNGSSYKGAISSIVAFDSNDQLGYSYYKAIKENNYQINLKTIKRIGDGFKDINPIDVNYTSAQAIRSDLSIIEMYTPEFVYKDKNKILDEEKLFPFIKYKILTHTALDLKNIFMVDEGLENRLFEVKNYDNFNEFINYLSTKRYTKTRIKRMLINILFGITKDSINNISHDFIRVLGYSEIGKKYLNSIKKNLNIYTNIKEGINTNLDIEMRVSKILDTIYNTSLALEEQKGPKTI